MTTRNRWSMLLVLVLVANLVLAGGPRVDEAYACSCAMTRSTEESFQRADAVFSGKVREIGQLPAPPDGSTALTMPYLNPVTFDVGEAWKGVSTESAVVHGEGPEASCGIDFDKDETYLVFAYHSREAQTSPLQTDFCGATEQIDVETARQMLGPPPDTLPKTGGVAPTPVKNGAASVYAAPAIILALALAGTLLARRIASGPRR